MDPLSHTAGEVGHDGVLEVVATSNLSPVQDLAMALMEAPDQPAIVEEEVQQRRRLCLTHALQHRLPTLLLLTLQHLTDGLMQVLVCG